MIKYICSTDYQGGDFAVGTIETIAGWCAYVRDWYEQDSDWGKYIEETFLSLKGSELLDYIQEIWEIEIVEYDENNAEHKKLAEKRGN